MQIQNLEKAKDLLLEAFLELDDAIDDVDATDDVLVNEIDGQKRAVQDIIGRLSVEIGKLKKRSKSA